MAIASAIENLRASLRGELLEPANPAYDSTRVVWNAMIDRRPALIARCQNAADVVASHKICARQFNGYRRSLRWPQCCRLRRL